MVRHWLQTSPFLAISATLAAYGISPAVAFGIGAAIGAIKEVLDPYLGGQRDAWDFIATTAGAMGVLPLILFSAG